MKIIKIETLISKEPFATSNKWIEVNSTIIEAIKKVDWPVGSGKFTLYDKRKDNGVKPIKNEFIQELINKFDWIAESRVVKGLGGIDIGLKTDLGMIALEWETGNISSSHRAINKLCLGLLRCEIIAGVLVLPTKPLASRLTDRIGNEPELAPYYDLWKSIPVENGVLQIIAIEHDSLSDDPKYRIPKGNDGRSQEAINRGISYDSTKSSLL